MKYVALFSLLISAISANAIPNGLDVNDVSILFPLKSPLNIRLNFRTKGSEVLLPEPLFNEIPAFIRTQKFYSQFYPDLGSYRDFRVIALRYDPCSKLSADQQSCTQQLRLTAQAELSFPPESHQLSPNQTIHLLFKLGDGMPKKGDPLVAALMKIKKLTEANGAETSGLPLRPHPGLEADTKSRSPSVASEVEALIKAFALPQNLTDLNVLATGEDIWAFFGGKVENHHWIPQPVANLGDSRFIAFYNSITINNAFIAPLPPPTAISARAFFLTKPATGGPQTITDDDLIMLQRVENPNFAHPRTVDCMSCHMSSNLLLEHVGNRFFNADTSYRTPPGLTGFAELEFAHDSVNFVNFGYFGDLPTINSIVANSSAHVANLVNASQDWNNPSSLDCSDPGVKSCFSGLGSRHTGSAAECLLLCKKRAN